LSSPRGQRRSFGIWNGWPDQVRIAAKIDSLAHDPRPRGVEKLSGEENLYRVRVGNYRIIYQLQDAQLIVLVVKVGHRRDVYRKR
jgi:mRNA interferase RelE/StbE